MARVILGNNETHTVFDNTQASDIFGSNGAADKVRIGGNTSAPVTVNSSVERVELAGKIGDYTFKGTGNELSVLSNGVVEAIIYTNADIGGTKVAFADGSALLTVSSAGLKIGGASVPAAAGAITAASAALDPSDPSKVPGSGPGPIQTFTLTSSAATVNEGSPVTFTVSNKSVAAGEYSYLLGGTIGASDIAGGLLNGTVKIDALGVGYVPVSILADSLTEGSETLTLSIGGVTSTAVTVNDTSLTSTAPLTLSLTTAADSLTGGTGGDTFNALAGTLITGTGMSFGANDILDGGAGTDTLFIQVNTLGVAGPASLSNIENISAVFFPSGGGALSGTVSLQNAKGVLSIESNGSSAPAAFTFIGDATNRLLVSNTNQPASFGFTPASVLGASDTANIVLNAVGGGAVAVTNAGFEAVSINSTVAPNTLASLNVPGATTITVIGDQSLNLGAALPDAVTTFNASGNTSAGAGVTAIFGASTTATAITGSGGNDTFDFSNVIGAVNVAAGAGNDIVTDLAGLRLIDTIAGGDGAADVLRTTAAAAEAYVTPATRTITGFEQLTITAGTAGAPLVLANVDTGITRLNIAGTGGAYPVTGPAGTLAVNTANPLGGALTLTDTGVAITDVATLTNTGVLNANVFNGQDVTSAGYETLNINTGSGAVTNAAAQTLGAVTVGADVGGTTAVNFTGSNDVTVGRITAVAVSAAGMGGAARFIQTAAAGATTTAITGTANADVILGGALGAALTGGAGADTITGGIGIDVINGGDGADSITGGVGRDQLTGGTGRDVFVFDTPTAIAVTSNLAAPDLITDFVSGTDKISLVQPVSGFLGNFPTFVAAQAAVIADGRANLAFFVTADNALYVRAAAGAQAAGGLNNGIFVDATTDTVISFSPGTVAGLVATDILQLDTQGVGRANIALTAAAANLGPAQQVNATATTTFADDTITTTAAFLSNSTIDGGTGLDTLVITTNPTAAAAFTLTTAGVGSGAAVDNIERITLNVGNTVNALTVPNTVGLAVTNASATVGSNILMGTGSGQSFTGAGSGIQTVTLGGNNQSVTTGTGADVITATAERLVNSRIAGGTGADTLTITGLSTAGNQANLTLSSTAPSAAGALMTGIETVTANVGAGFGTLTLVPDANLTVNFVGAVPQTVNGTGSTITIGQVAAQPLTLAGTSNFAVTGGTTGAITSTATGTLAVTSSANSQTVTSVSATTVNAAALNGTLTVAGANANTAFTVNGLGTVAGGVVTEGAGFTGTLTVNTVDTANSTITQASAAAAVRAFVLNASDDGLGAGSAGTVTLTALANHASQTINLTAVGAATDVRVTVGATSTATAYTVNAIGAGTHFYVNASTTPSVDTYNGSVGSDAVSPGLGADIINLGNDNAVDVLFMASPTVDTGVALGFVPTVAVPTAAINVAGMDKVTNFGRGDTITLGLTTATTFVRNGGPIVSDTDGSVALIAGTYTAGNQLFTPALAGADTLFVYDDNGTTALGTFRGVVLIGYVDLVGNATLTTLGDFTAG